MIAHASKPVSIELYPNHCCATLSFYEGSPYTVTITENKSRFTVVEPLLTRGLALQVFGSFFNNNAKLASV